MKKILLSILLITAGFLFTYGQAPVGPQISIGAEIGMPTGDANKVFNLVEGGSIKFELALQKNLFFTLTAGYNVFKVYPYYSYYIQDGQYIPIEIGLKNYVQGSNVFVEGDAGVSLNNNSNFTGRRAAFIFAPAIGVSLVKNKIDISARFESRVESSTASVTQLALRLAVKFGTN